MATKKPFSGQGFQDVIKNGPYPIRFPTGDLDQDEEWCEVQVAGQWRKIRFHDYRLVYEIPGLYETIFYRTLRCNSPTRVANLLNETLIEINVSPEDLRVLDFGAGNGMAGEALQTLGTRKIIGTDILPEAKKANWRDRPWVYEDYLVLDFTNLTEDQRQFLNAYQFNTLMIVAALGYGDIPPKAFQVAYNCVLEDGLLAFNIKYEFLRSGLGGGFSRLINRMIDENLIEIEAYKRYRHRLNIAGEPLFYVALVAKKLRDIPDQWV